MSAAPEFPAEVLAASALHLEDAIRSSYGPATKYQPRSNNASRCGHPCAYYLWAVRARWEDLPTPDPGMPGIWAIGREHERAVQQALLQEGWSLRATQITFEDTDLDLRGRIDWELSKPGHVFWEHPVKTEFKSVSANYFDQLNSFADCFNSPMPWVRLWPYQLLSYAYLSPDDDRYVCLLLRDKTSGRPRAIIEEADKHFDRLVEVGERLAAVNAALRDGTEPSPMSYDPVWCDRCDAAAICPAMQRREIGSGGLVLVEDPTAIEAEADVWMAANEERKAAERAWEALKKHAAHYGLYDAEPGESRTAVAGRYRLTVKTGSRSGRLEVVPVGDESDADDGTE